MHRTRKVWGERWMLRQDSTHATSYLEIEPWMRCSWHTHREKYNMFIITEGELDILTEDGTVVLVRGDTFVVPPGVKHEFRTRELGCKCVEEMYVDYAESDIQRERIGGKWSSEQE